MSKADITLTKSIIFGDIENLLNDIIALKYVNIEVGMGFDKYYPDKDLEPEYLERIDKLKSILDKAHVPLKNIRMHVPVEYRYDVYDDLYCEGKYHNSFDAMERFILKAHQLGFRSFVVHPPSFCIETDYKLKIGDVSSPSIRKYDFDKVFDDYCRKLRKLHKQVGSNFVGNLTGNVYGIFIEYTGTKDSTEIIENDHSITKKTYVGINMSMYKEILRRTQVHALLDTGVFDSINEYKIAKLNLEKEGFKIRALHLQQSQFDAHHNPLTEEQFRKVIEDFSGIIIDEGLFNHRFKEGELHAAMRKGEDKNYYLTKQEHLDYLKSYLSILGPRAKLVFKLNEVLDKDLK